MLALSRLLYGEDNYAVESQDYFMLSRVALTLDSPVTSTTVTSVQTIVRGLFTVTYEVSSNTGLHGGVLGAERRPNRSNQLRQGLGVHWDGYEARS